MKLLPEEPTQEMVEAAISINSLHDLTLEQQASAIYKAMHQAAPEVEPLSKYSIGSLWEMYGIEDNCTPFAREIEKAHGIGVV